MPWRMHWHCYSDQHGVAVKLACLGEYVGIKSLNRTTALPVSADIEIGDASSDNEGDTVGGDDDVAARDKATDMNEEDEEGEDANDANDADRSDDSENLDDGLTNFVNYNNLCDDMS